jgi:hypothetical protein
MDAQRQIRAEPERLGSRWARFSTSGQKAGSEPNREGSK